jgi:hypothetical protein
MNSIEGLWRWIRSGEPKAVGDATFEELFSGDYPDDQAFPELVRRLKPIVRAMAHCDNPATAEQVSNGIFVEFTHLFPGSPPQGGLQRLASLIRDRIGPEAFYAGGQARIFYTQLALYKLPDRQLRKCLEFFFCRGLQRLEKQTLAAELASALDIDPAETVPLARRAWKALGEVMSQQFDGEDWKRWTEGYLPWPYQPEDNQ